MTDIRIQFPTDRAAERTLRDAGFSIGTNQRREPRGILYGDYLIAKWRNLRARERADLDGELRHHGPPGSPVTVVLRPGRVPVEVVDAIRAATTNHKQPDSKVC